MEEVLFPVRLSSLSNALFSLINLKFKVFLATEVEITTVVGDLIEVGREVAVDIMEVDITDDLFSAEQSYRFQFTTVLITTKSQYFAKIQV